MVKLITLPGPSGLLSKSMGPVDPLVLKMLQHSKEARQKTVKPTEQYTLTRPSTEYLKILLATMLYLLHSVLPDFCQASSVREGKRKHTYFSHTVPHACAVSAVIHLRWRLHPTQHLGDSSQMRGQADKPESSL